LNTSQHRTPLGRLVLRHAGLPEQRREVIVLFVRGLGVATGRSFQWGYLEGLVLDECGARDLLSRASEPRVQGTANSININLRRRRGLQFLAALIN